ncbi:MAG: ral stress protein [Bacteroidetes bacterium]|nr:ral stress protein [Bacteroidota bacterium]
MGNVKHLAYGEAIEKMKKLAEDINICMFCTGSKLPFETRPMATQQVDSDGNFWFLSDSSSDKNMEIKEGTDVQLIYAKPGDSHFMSVAGKAIVLKDKPVIEGLWTPMAKAWFKGGVDDPNLTAICVKPEDAYYWDTENGKMVSLVKIAVAAMSNKETDDGGVEGKMKI